MIVSLVHKSATVQEIVELLSRSADKTHISLEPISVEAFEPESLLAYRLVESVETALENVEPPVYFVIRGERTVSVRMHARERTVTAHFVVDEDTPFGELESLPKWAALIVQNPDWAISASRLAERLLR